MPSPSVEPLWARLHNAERQVVRVWKGKPWVTCALSFKERKRELMSPISYTELVCRDEPTAYTAGHRPCAECRWPAYKLFKEDWTRAFPEQQDLSAKAIDNLPDGSMIVHDGECVLLWRGHQWHWSFDGDRPLQQAIPREKKVRVLTPEPFVRLFAAGLEEVLAVHPSINNRDQ